MAKALWIRSWTYLGFGFTDIFCLHLVINFMIKWSQYLIKIRYYHILAFCFMKSSTKSQKYVSQILKASFAMWWIAAFVSQYKDYHYRQQIAKTTTLISCFTCLLTLDYLQHNFLTILFGIYHISFAVNLNKMNIFTWTKISLSSSYATR